MFKGKTKFLVLFAMIITITLLSFGTAAAQDSDCGCDPTPETIEEVNQLPVCSGIATVDDGVAPDQVRLRSTATDPDGDAVNLASWKFADSDEEHGLEVLHWFVEPGYHEVYLTVRDEHGAYSEKCQIVLYLEDPEFDGTFPEVCPEHGGVCPDEMDEPETEEAEPEEEAESPDEEVPEAEDAEGEPTGNDCDFDADSETDNHGIVMNVCQNTGTMTVTVNNNPPDTVVVTKTVFITDTEGIAQINERITALEDDIEPSAFVDNVFDSIRDFFAGAIRWIWDNLTRLFLVGLLAAIIAFLLWDWRQRRRRQDRPS